MIFGVHLIAYRPSPVRIPGYIIVRGQSFGQLCVTEEGVQFDWSHWEEKKGCEVSY